MDELKRYVKAVGTAGILWPVFLHLVNPEAMPWWPDAVSMGIASAAVAAAIVWKARADQDLNRRLWTALKALVRQRGSY